jgi:hypothetical protein
MQVGAVAHEKLKVLPFRMPDNDLVEGIVLRARTSLK